MQRKFLRQVMFTNEYSYCPWYAHSFAIRDVFLTYFWFAETMLCFQADGDRSRTALTAGPPYSDDEQPARSSHIISIIATYCMLRAGPSYPRRLVAIEVPYPVLSSNDTGSGVPAFGGSSLAALEPWALVGCGPWNGRIPRGPGWLSHHCDCCPSVVSPAGVVSGGSSRAPRANHNCKSNGNLDSSNWCGQTGYWVLRNSVMRKAAPLEIWMW
jgi:hypothetical protein